MTFEDALRKIVAEEIASTKSPRHTAALLFCWCEGGTDHLAPTTGLDVATFYTKTTSYKRDLDEGLVYIIATADRPIVKIGFSTDIKKRLSDLQNACPDNLALLATMRGGRLLERTLHRSLSPLRIRGEWFRREGPIEHLLTLLAAGPERWGNNWIYPGREP